MTAHLPPPHVWRAATQNGVPLEIHLPDGQRALLVPGSRPARYTVNGETTTIEVEIPEDLCAAGWIWSGSFLYQPYTDRDDGSGVAIATSTYGVPGWPCTRKTCFEVARDMDRLRAEHVAARAIRSVKKAKKKAKTKPPAGALELLRRTETARAAYEQMEMAL